MNYENTNESLQHELYISIDSKDIHQLRGLIVTGVDLNQANTYGSPMKLAAQQGNFEINKILLEAGGNPNNNELGSTPFQALAFYLHHGGQENTKSAQLIRLYLEHGADLAWHSNHDHSLLKTASPSLIPIIEQTYAKWLNDGAPTFERHPPKIKFK